MLTFFLDSLCHVPYFFGSVTGGCLSWNDTQSCTRFLADLWDSLQSCGNHVPCGAAELIFLVGLGLIYVSYALAEDVSRLRHANRRDCSLPSSLAVRWKMWTRVSILRELDHFCNTYNISVDLGPELPGREDTIKDAPAGKIGIYTRFLEFANFRVPLSRFLLRVLEYYQINFSQLSVLGASKIDASICPIYVPWHTGASILKDPLPSDNRVNVELLALLDHHYMGLLDFVKSADPFKVKTRERTLAEGEVSLNNKTVNMTVPPSVEIIQIVDHTIMDEAKEHAVVPTNGGKGLAALKRLELQNEPRGVGSSSVQPPIEEFVSSSVTPTPEPDIPEGSGSSQEGGIRIHHACMGIVVSSSFGPDDEAASPRVEDIVVDSAGGVGALGNNVEASTFPPDAASPTDDFYDSQTVETATADNIYVPEWGVTNGARVDNPALCRNLLDHITPPGYWALLRNLSPATFLDGFNINSAQHTCMVSELRLRYEHEIMTMEKFQKKFTNTCAVVQQRDAEIAALGTRLEKAERDATEVVSLRGRVSELEAGVAVKSQEVDTLGTQNAELSSKVSALESERGELKRHVVKLGGDFERLRKEAIGEAKLREEFKSFQDAEARHGLRWLLSHGVRLEVMKCAQSAECQSALGKVEAYNPWVKDDFVSAVTDFENVSFSLLDELQLLKDSPLASIMSALVLKDAQGNVVSTSEL
ncbi:hypothetical protein Tco_0407679 [Tanacetum coccineum]